MTSSCVLLVLKSDACTSWLSAADRLVVMASSLSVVPQELDLDLYAGDNFVLKVVRKDSTGTPIPLVGSYSGTIEDSTGLARTTFTVDSSGAASGILYLKLNTTQTAALCGSSNYFRGKYDFQWTDNAGTVLTLLFGGVTCTKDISV